MRFIRHTFDVDAKLVGNEIADIIGGKDFSHSRCLWTRSQAGDAHDKAPESVERLAADHEIRPAMWLGEVLRAYRPTYTLLCIYKSSKQKGHLPGGMWQACHTARQCGSG